MGTSESHATATVAPHRHRYLRLGSRLYKDIVLTHVLKLPPTQTAHTRNTQPHVSRDQWARRSHTQQPPWRHTATDTYDWEADCTRTLSSHTSSSCLRRKQHTRGTPSHT